jgi:tetrapyrrole methylase family protein / MazG family protein
MRPRRRPPISSSITTLSQGSRPVIEAALRDLEARFGVTAAEGLQVVTADALPGRPFDPGWGLLILPGAAGPPTTALGFVPPVLPGRHARPADPLAILSALYPADHPVRGLLGATDTTIGAWPASDLAAPEGAWFVPPLLGEANLASPHGLPWLAARLRAPDGCPWDREQTHLTLRKHLLEEAYEVYDALEDGPTPALADELGDLLLQIVLHAEHAAEAGVFDLSDVYRSIMAKIVRRHPHVFGEVEARTVGDVLRNWETIKAGERADRLAHAATVDEPGTSGADARSGTDVSTPELDKRPGMPAAFAGVSRSLPALAYAQEIQERAASLGYDWPDVEGVIDKLEEEALELLGAADQAERREEFGDLLLVMVNLGRKLGLDAEASLRSANAKFAGRFARVERLAEERTLATMTFEELDQLWARAKREEADERERTS